jgi:hypothetical protein
MPTASVSTFHKSGGLSSSDVAPDRLHVKIGQAEIGDKNKVYLISSYNQGKDIFGKGQLVDSLEQHFEEFDLNLGQKPVPLFCVRAENDLVGSVDVSRDSNNSGLAVAPVSSGTPVASHSVILMITKEGAGGVAEYRISFDQGATYASAKIIPASGSALSIASGVSITFTDDGTTANATFTVGDLFHLEINGPQASDASRLEALESLKQEYRPYFIHMLGSVSRAFAISADAILSEMADTYNLPTYLILEASPVKGLSESISDYYNNLVTEFDPFFSERISIVTAEGRYIKGGIDSNGGYTIVNSDDSLGEWRNAGTLLAAKLSAAPPNVSAGYVKLMRSLTFSEIRYWHEGYQDYMDIMHDKRLTVLKEYNNYDGIFIARDQIKSRPESDFAEVPERRRADKMHRIVYQKSLPHLNEDSNTESGSGGIDYIQAEVSAEVASKMLKAGEAEISGFEVLLDPDQTFATSKILKAKMVMYVAGRYKAIEWTTSFALSE